jgi:hypothetical protein
VAVAGLIRRLLEAGAGIDGVRMLKRLAERDIRRSSGSGASAPARSGDRIAIAAYLGGSDVFDKAITQFAVAYADQNERDHQALIDAVKSGRITAEPGV